MKSLLMFSLLILTSPACDLQFQDTTTTVFDGQPVQLTKDSSRKSDPAWSPDGSLIAYSAMGIATNLFRMSLEGEDLDKFGRVEDGIGDRKFDISIDGAPRIVYHATVRGHLWVTNLQDGSEFKLTPNHPFARDPAWSPNAQEVAFSASGSGSLNIYVIPASGGTARQITDQDGQESNPTWSPDGNRIAFQSQRNGNSQIWIADLQADTLIQFTPDSVESGRPDWSPDGSKIAYQATRNDTTAIWITSLADSTSEKLTTHTAIALNPSWSQDGSRIAYRSSNGIEISSLDGDVLFQIDTNQSFPTWLPDGNSLVRLEHVSYANIRLFLLSDSLTIPVTQPVDRQFDASPAWYPDSRKLVFVRRNTELFSGQTLWTKSILGGEARPLIGEPSRGGIEFDPAVSPDGKWLVYDNRNRIFLIQLAGGPPIDLSPFIGIGLREPAWAPDSQGFICTTRENLKLFSTDSSLVVQESVIPGSFFEPAWSKPHPVFGANLALTGSGGIYVMQPDGSKEDFVVARGIAPSWSPEGTRLAYIDNRDHQVFIIPVFEPITTN